MEPVLLTAAVNAYFAILAINDHFIAKRIFNNSYPKVALLVPSLSRIDLLPDLAIFKDAEPLPVQGLFT